MKENLRSMMAGLVGAMLVLGVAAIADSNPGTDQVPKLIPYHGTLEKDGHGLNGAAKLHFRIFDGKTATTAVWDESLDVTAYNGRFTALLGSSGSKSAQDLTKVITNADDLYLGVAIVKADNTEIALSNRQRFLPVPYAMWTTASTDFKVGRNLTVGKNLTVNGYLFTPGIQVGGLNGKTEKTSIQREYITGYPELHLNDTHSHSNIIAGGAIVMEANDLVFSQNSSRGKGGRAMVHYFNNTLVLNFDGDFEGGVKVGSRLYVDGAISGKNLANPGDGDVAKDVSGGVGFGNWGGWTKCDVGYYMCGFAQKYEGKQGNGDDTGVDDTKILCCKF